MRQSSNNCAIRYCEPQSQKDFSSSRDNSVYSKEDITGSLLVSEPNDQNNGYVSHDWWSMDRLTFEGGGGFIIPTGSARQYENMGWNIKAGGGYRLNDRFSAMLDYDYVSMGVPSAILNQVNPQGGRGHAPLVADNQPDLQLHIHWPMGWLCSGRRRLLPQSCQFYPTFQ
jgi:hypothetical protein